eukprot:CAMPEP_0183790614 /NCGR_PEP_ID=MMETSP0803_2-20130417/1218_1 /TAXON_ID=195967 /ORGANISM="Crustomastix stigmata, Strain CCMP3273" /LENGTH=302 /DNA_ID=CAMNT_0026034855 /DNA_START=49 /DNA_END=957 /DNA_ORIENTATION=-
MAAPMDKVPLIDSQTAGILASVNNFTIQQHPSYFDNCIEMPNKYTIFDRDNGTKLLLAEEESECCNRVCCAPNHSLLVKIFATDPQGNKLFPVLTMEREGCCSKQLHCFACMDCCLQESFIHAGEVSGEPGKLEKDKVIGHSKVPVGGGGLTPTVQIMDRGYSQDEPLAVMQGPTCFGGCSEMCCDFNFFIDKVPSGTTDYKALKVGNMAKITKCKPKGFGGAMREMLSDADTFTLEITDPSVTPQQKASLISSLVHIDYMFFEKNIDMCGVDGNGAFFINLCNCYCVGCLCPCKLKCKAQG